MPQLAKRSVSVREQIAFGAVFAFMLLALVYASIMIAMTSGHLRDHMAYIQARDARWEDLHKRILTHIEREETRWEAR